MIIFGFVISADVFYLGEDSILVLAGDWDMMLFFWKGTETISDLVKLLFECFIVPNLSYWGGDDCSDIKLLFIPILGSDSSRY